MILALDTDKQLILFDGVCNLCNATVQYVIKHDKKDIFRFAPLQSDIGAQIIDHFKVDVSKTDSILLYLPTGHLKNKSTAALYIAKHLGFPNNMMFASIIIPAFIRNLVYDYIAKNRYKWFGKQEHCMIPTPELKAKFLS